MASLRIIADETKAEASSACRTESEELTGFDCIHPLVFDVCPADPREIEGRVRIVR